MADSTSVDVIVVGAGIAGASAAAELARDGRVVLIEREETPGYHATGRSAAVLAQTYGNQVVRQLTHASLDMLLHPPRGFSASPLVTPRPIVLVARHDQIEHLRQALYETDTLEYWRHLSNEALFATAPLLRRGYAAEGLINDAAKEIDVSGFHHGYLRAFRQLGGKFVVNEPVQTLRREGSLWVAETPSHRFAAPVMVNAGGAWADEVAAMAGVAPIGLTPMRRTALTVPAPDGVSVSDHPMVVDAEEQFYLKPDAGRLLLSPGDETPSPPCDSQPEELDVAVAIDRIEQAFDLSVKRIESRWAGLRTFTADRTPVCGFDASASGFFWLAGQGGYGVQTAPAMARLTRSLVAGKPMHTKLKNAGIAITDLAPQRLRKAA